MAAASVKDVELIGVFSWEKNVFEDEVPELRTIIGELDDRTTIKGKAEEGELENGGTYLFLGHWVTHQRYGRQFFFHSFCRSQPQSDRGTVLYLTRCDGIGEIRARALVEAFGAKGCLDVLKNTPERAAEVISGLTVEKARLASEVLKKDEAIERTTIELTELLAGRGLPKKTPELARKKWGANAPEIIRANPYELIGFPGIRFRSADRIYRELGLDLSALERQAWCIVDAVEQDKEGHVWIDLDEVGKYLRQSIPDQDRLRIEDALRWGIDREYIEHREAVGKRWIAAGSLARHERAVLEGLLAAAGEAVEWPCLDDVKVKGDCDICHGDGCDNCAEWPTRHQVDELSKSLDGKIGILAGSPGTGKTWLLAWLIDGILSSGVHHHRIVVCAPTGKAAVRITQALAEHDLGITALTIHSTLGVVSSDGGWTFEHDETNPLPVDYFFVDESSMCDLPLLSALLRARGNAHVLFVGDPDQLAPVGPGAPLRDQIAGGVPCGHLKEIRRNAGRIVRACAEMRDNHVYTPSPGGLDLDAGENLVHVQCRTVEEHVSEIFATLAHAKELGLDPLWDVQVVCPLNDASQISRKPLNKLLRAKLNPKGEQKGNNPFWVGDKIICTENGFLPAINPGDRGTDQAGRVRVANGEQAAVTRVELGFTEAVIPDPYCKVRIPRGQSDDKNESDTGCNWELGYVISVHKSQGSEWPIVHIVIDDYGGAVRLCDRHWLFTGTSRGKLYTKTAGRLDIAANMPRISHMWKRKTFLASDLSESRLAGMFEEWEEFCNDK